MVAPLNSLRIAYNALCEQLSQVTDIINLPVYGIIFKNFSHTGTMEVTFNFQGREIKNIIKKFLLFY